MSEFRYAAFISYSSMDAAFARRLHRALEHYAIPGALGSFTFSSANKPNRLYPIFRDREELPAGDLSEAITDALQSAGALIVVCSPNAAKSKWVNKEIEHFLATGRRDRIFAIIADDAPLQAARGDSAQACFPPAFSDGRFEPIAADARPSKDGFRAAWLKVVAGLCDVNAGALADRDKARRTRQRWLTGGAIAASVLLAAAAGAWAITQNSISVQAGGLVQEAIRSDNPLLAALAAEAPLPGFQVNGAAARDFLTAHRGLNTVSQAEIDRARVVKLDDMSLGGAVRRRLPEGARVEVSPGAFIEILYTCARTYTTTCPVTAVLHDGPAQRRIVADDATIQVSDGNARRAWTYASLAALLPEAPSAAVQAPVGEYDVLFGLAPSANAASRVRPEVLAVSRDASTLGWSAENNLFFVRLDDAAAVPRAMRVDFPVYDLRPLGGADWLVVGREASVVVSLADTPRVTPAPERVVGVGEIAYSESHRRGLAPGETNSAFFHVGPGGIEIDQQAAIAADIALASRDGEWLASYGEGALRVYSARDAALVQTQEFIRSTRSDGFVSFGQLDAMPAVIFLDLTGGVHIASLAAPPPIGSALFYERFCSARLVEAGRAEVRRIAPLFARRWREIESRCLNLEAEE